MVGEEDPFEPTRMSLGEHLEELRKRVLRGAIAVIVAFFVGWGFHEKIDTVVRRPLVQVLEWIDQDQVAKYEERLAAEPDTARATYFQSNDAADRNLRPEFTVSRRVAVMAFPEYFVYALKISLFFALLVGSPILLYQLWQFVAAGLYAKEKRIVAGVLPVSIGLFLAGATFGYFILIPYGMYFLASASPIEQFDFMPRLSEYLTFLSGLTLALGFVFQLPLVLTTLVRVDLVQRKTFAKYRPHFIVAAFVMGAVLTPPDPITQLLMAVPMMLLYEIGLWAARYFEKEPIVEEPLEEGAS